MPIILRAGMWVSKCSSCICHVFLSYAGAELVKDYIIYMLLKYYGLPHVLAQKENLR